MADAFSHGLANFNIKVAEIAGSPETQKKIQSMYGKVIESIEDAFKMPATTEGKAIIESLDKTGRTHQANRETNWLLECWELLWI